MSGIYLDAKASKARIREAEEARKHRAEIVRELSWGRVSRRDLIKMGLFTAFGALAPIRGLNPFTKSVYADGSIKLPPSPLFGCQPFTTPMPRFDVLKRQSVDSLNPVPTAAANETLQAFDPALNNNVGGFGPMEGRPPGPIWAHQGFDLFPPRVAYDVKQGCATTNTTYNPQVFNNSHNSGISPSDSLPLRFHPALPTQDLNSVWTFNGTIPPKLVLGRYGEPILFRHHNTLPADQSQNNGFGRHTISTHEHNGHHGAENDGFTGAFFFPGQFYDYHWPIVLAGWKTINADASDPRASSPADNGGLNKVAGDWRETMSTHWFHDHMFSFTSQNVYKGNAAMFNIYSGLDRGNEEVNDGVNLRLPSGTAKSWGNLEYDVNLMLADKAFDRSGQLTMDIFNFDGFVADCMTVNLTYKPYFLVERRKYRFRILNASVSRFFKVALADSDDNGNAPVPFQQIANDGNLLPSPVTLTELDEQGIAERYDIVIDFRNVKGSKAYLVNLCDHFDPGDGTLDGTKPVRDVTLAEALGGASLDPCVGKFLEFRIGAQTTDNSQVPATLIPNPDLSSIPVARERFFDFGRGAIQTNSDPISSFIGGPWGIGTDGAPVRLQADFGRISAAPRLGTREVWTLKTGGGWDHPIHIHFEEGQILARNGKASEVPAWERGRKDVYRLHPGSSVTLTMQFRDWGGMFMEHCHNTMHEDNAMLLRWELDDGGAPFLRPLPTPIPTPQGVTFRAPTEILPTAY
ncbi:MAG TPA: multicopper oxidase domain-containing protein [Vicinamibacterales bacterium]|nr:multicopper oxidase domain-containing protein [Vicinamibacterales bacterium]